MKKVGSTVTVGRKSVRLNDVSQVKTFAPDPPTFSWSKTTLDRKEKADPSNSDIKLCRAFTRQPDVDIINFTGIHHHHVAYAASGYIVIHDYVNDHQKFLKGHKNKITCLTWDEDIHAMISADAGDDSSLIVWDAEQWRIVAFVKKPHRGGTRHIACIESEGSMIATLGNERAGHQSIKIWLYDQNLKKNKLRLVCIGRVPLDACLQTRLVFGRLVGNLFVSTGKSAPVFYNWDYATNEIFPFKPDISPQLMRKLKGFTQSTWTQDNETVFTGTRSGYLVLWETPTPLGEELPLNPLFNTKTVRAYFHVTHHPLTYVTQYMNYTIVGDSEGIVWYFDRDLRLLHRTEKVLGQSVVSLSFNMNQNAPDFLRTWRQCARSNDVRKKKVSQTSFIRSSFSVFKLENSTLPPEQDFSKALVRDHLGGQHPDPVYQNTLEERRPLNSPDFVLGLKDGSIVYYHVALNKADYFMRGLSEGIAAIDVCPSSHRILIASRAGDIQVYDFRNEKLESHQRVLRKKWRTSPQLTTIKFHPLGNLILLGTTDGRIHVHRSYSWNYHGEIPQHTIEPIRKLIFSKNGLFLCVLDEVHSIIIYKTIPRKLHWEKYAIFRSLMGAIVDTKFWVDSERNQRLFTLGTDNVLVDYNLSKSFDKNLIPAMTYKLGGLHCPTAMLFNAVPELGHDCVLIANSVNKLLAYDLERKDILRTSHGLQNAQCFTMMKGLSLLDQNENRVQEYFFACTDSELVKLKCPLDGNQSQYKNISAHCGGIADIGISQLKQGYMFTVGNNDNTVFMWDPKISKDWECCNQGDMEGNVPRTEKMETRNVSRTQTTGESNKSELPPFTQYTALNTASAVNGSVPGASNFPGFSDFMDTFNDFQERAVKSSFQPEACPQIQNSQEDSPVTPDFNSHFTAERQSDENPLGPFDKIEDFPFTLQRANCWIKPFQELSITEPFEKRQAVGRRLSKQQDSKVNPRLKKVMQNFFRKRNSQKANTFRKEPSFKSKKALLVPTSTTLPLSLFQEHFKTHGSSKPIALYRRRVNAHKTVSDPILYQPPRGIMKLAGLCDVTVPKPVKDNTIATIQTNDPFLKLLQNHFPSTDLLAQLDLLFFYINLKTIDRVENVGRMQRDRIPIKSMHIAARALGYFPSKFEINLMRKEAVRTNVRLHRKDPMNIRLPDFVKILANHYYCITKDHFKDAIKTLELYPSKALLEQNIPEIEGFYDSFEDKRWLLENKEVTLKHATEEQEDEYEGESSMAEFDMKAGSIDSYEFENVILEDVDKYHQRLLEEKEQSEDFEDEYEEQGAEDEEIYNEFLEASQKYGNMNLHEAIQHRKVSNQLEEEDVASEIHDERTDLFITQENDLDTEFVGDDASFLEYDDDEHEIVEEFNDDDELLQGQE